MALELHDEWENSSAGGPPVISWNRAHPGEPGAKFTGVIVPPLPLVQPGKGYRKIEDRTTDGLRVWPPKVGYTPAPGIKPNAPILESQYLAITGSDAEMRPVALTEITLVTGYTGMDFMSEPKRKAAKEESLTDDGVRRVIVDGADLPAKITAAVKALRTAGPQPGQRLTIELIERAPNVGREGNKNVFAVTLEPPTPETLKVAADWVAQAKSAAASEKVEDSWESSGEPAF